MDNKCLWRWPEGHSTYCLDHCEETADICRALGCEVPFVPAELSTSEASSINVARHCIDYLETVEGDEPYDWVLLLQPTSPLRTSADIVAALDIASTRCVTAVISVCEVIDSHPRLKTIKDNILKPYLGDKFQQVQGKNCLHRSSGQMVQFILPDGMS